MNGQILQIIQKVHSLEESERSHTSKLKTLEEKVWDLSHKSIRPVETLPSGTIILFAGQKIPPGWILCDGQNGTPNISFPFSEEAQENPVYIMKVA